MTSSKKLSQVYNHFQNALIPYHCSVYACYRKHMGKPKKRTLSNKMCCPVVSCT